MVVTPRWGEGGSCAFISGVSRPCVPLIWSVTAPFNRQAVSCSQVLDPVWVPGMSEPNKIDGEKACVELASK